MKKLGLEFNLYLQKIKKIMIFQIGFLFFKILLLDTKAKSNHIINNNINSKITKVTIFHFMNDKLNSMSF